jgi:hypothetical protein
MVGESLLEDSVDGKPELDGVINTSVIQQV